MKRIAMFCDGTWSKMSAEFPTNVLLAAQSVRARGVGEVPQVAFYDEGVGTSFVANEWVETRLAGAFGWGLFDKIAAAYRFLIVNYEPGDEIFLFGFSRGAFTARSLAGLIRKCGIIPHADAPRIQAAFDFYKTASIHPDDDAAQQFRMDNCPEVVLKEQDRDWRIRHAARPAAVADLPLLMIKYIGVWDTVGALGVPRHLLLGKLAGGIKKYEFHDLKLSSTVQGARHAVAVDEDRLSFEPTLWDNLDVLNAERGHGAAYQQLWFPGDHGSVGGGGDRRALSSDALLWILEGAEDQGLLFGETIKKTARTEANPFGELTNQSKPPGWTEGVYRRGARKGPDRRALLAPSTMARLDRPGVAATGRQNRADWVLYRPETLRAVWPA